MIDEHSQRLLFATQRSLDASILETLENTFQIEINFRTEVHSSTEVVFYLDAPKGQQELDQRCGSWQSVP